MQDADALAAIQDHYGDRCAERSGVPLINHINEGRAVLLELGAHWKTVVAFTLHPLFQTDEELVRTLAGTRVAERLSGDVMMAVMEYRNVANRSLSDIIHESWSGGPHQDTRTLHCPPIRLSPLGSVNEMLIADKVQNRKDFERYHLGKHPRSAELDLYFREWLKALGVSDEEYLHLCGVMEAIQ